ncbi:hypothetical protein PYW07_006442 [Mythimna separata]|uniref:Uncharacterized protein n=1 Tax=Mythimna separata TaxID=271217 RepID=A0AAD7YUI2_MYTSE|nr:hypothetical protein PYW07_006442 [Mythimna separata]
MDYLTKGPGEWLVMHIGHCENPEKFEFVYEIIRKKINRTHDSYDIILQLEREFNSSLGLQVDVYQEVDGGFKYFQSIKDGCACSFIMKYAEDNLKRAYRMAGIDPPDCPYGPGPIVIRNFVMDYRELPKHAIYGTFQAYTYATHKKKKLGCVKIILNFDKRNDDDIF